MLTDAGGSPRATDPRLVRLQDALAAADGVESVSPPSVNESGSAAVFALTAATRPADPVTSDLVRRLRETVIPEATAGSGITAYVGGVTAAFDDLAAIISSRLPLVIGVVLALSFVVLLVAFRSVLVPLKAILCNLLAVGAAFGILTAFFQWGWGLGLIGLENAYGTVPIASYVPLIMFAVLFGMSTDYEVFLISQIFHAHAEGMDTHAAVRTGVGSSARVITAAAIIMVTVFASFTLTSDPIIKEFGVGLSIAILLDATIVRLVIVPSTMVLLGEWNWWLPRWLQWLPQVDLPDERAGEPADDGASSPRRRRPPDAAGRSNGLPPNAEGSSPLCGDAPGPRGGRLTAPLRGDSDETHRATHGTRLRCLEDGLRRTRAGTGAVRLHRPHPLPRRRRSEQRDPLSGLRVARARRRVHEGSLAARGDGEGRRDLGTSRHLGGRAGELRLRRAPGCLTADGSWRSGGAAGPGEGRRRPPCRPRSPELAGSCGAGGRGLGSSRCRPAPHGARDRGSLTGRGHMDGRLRSTLRITPGFGTRLALRARWRS